MIDTVSVKPSSNDDGRAGAASASRGRRSPDESRELIIAGARRVLERKTVAEVTVGDVMEATPLGRSSFYVHFEDLFALWQAMLEENVPLFLAPVEPFLADPSAETLELAIHQLVDVWYPNRRWWGELVGSAMAGGSRLGQQWRATELDLWGPTIGTLIPPDAPVLAGGVAPEAVGRRVVLLILASLAEVAHDDEIDVPGLAATLSAIAGTLFYGAAEARAGG